MGAMTRAEREKMMTDALEKCRQGLIAKYKPRFEKAGVKNAQQTAELMADFIMENTYISPGPGLWESHIPGRER